MNRGSNLSVPEELQAKRMDILVLFFLRPDAEEEAMVLLGGML